MRRALLWILSILATASVVTFASLALTLSFVGPGTTRGEPPVAGEQTPAPTPPAGIIPPEEASNARTLAVDFINAAAAGSFARTQALAAPCAPASEVGAHALADSVQHFAPRVQSAGVLPGRQPYAPSNPCSLNARVLVWVMYDLNGKSTLAHYQVDLQQQDGRWAVAGVTGPKVPPRGYSLFSAPVYDLKGNELSASAWEGKALLLVAPRQPDDALPARLDRLRKALAPQGVQLVLALDLGSPQDWEKFAVAKGYRGEIWRLKGRVEQVPVPNSRAYLGSLGLLVDPAGRVMGGFNALNPGTYGLGGEPEEIAPAVLAAYHMAE